MMGTALILRYWKMEGVRIIGGFKECENARRRPESGTEVELTVPGTTAYQAGRLKSIAAWFPGLSGSDGEQL